MRTKNPIASLNKIEEIFVKNNIPYVGKIFEVFKKDREIRSNKK